MPGLAAVSKPLLLHQFLAGLPGPIFKQLRTVGVTDDVVERAKILMAVTEHEKLQQQYPIRQQNLAI